MKNIERERVFLVNKLPVDLEEIKPIICESGDFYDHNSVDALKIRRRDRGYELIKKEGNTQKRVEHIITIKKGEYDILIKLAKQKHKKLSYNYPFNEYVCEIDLYQDKLAGYARVEVEFDSQKELEKFVPPDWFGIEITDINHEIHEDLGLVSFKDLQDRYSKIKIQLKKVSL